MPPTTAQALLAIWRTLGGSGEAARTANVTLTWAPAANEGIVKPQVDPAAGETQLHSGSDEAASKVLFAGTVSAK